MAQLPDDELCTPAGEQDNAIVNLVWHLAGNLESRFTDFLTSDGEKPWRKRDEEFIRHQVDRATILERWETGFRVLFDALGQLTDADLARTITIRGEPLSVVRALHRSVAHTAYHVGQMVYIAKTRRGSDWKTLTLPKAR